MTVYLDPASKADKKLVEQCIPTGTRFDTALERAKTLTDEQLIWLAGDGGFAPQSRHIAAVCELIARFDARSSRLRAIRDLVQ